METGTEKKLGMWITRVEYEDGTYSSGKCAARLSFNTALKLTIDSDMRNCKAIKSVHLYREEI